MMIHLTPGPTLLHMGALHTYEQILVLLLAFGPVVALAVVVYVVRRRDLASESTEPPYDEPDQDRLPAG